MAFGLALAHQLLVLGLGHLHLMLHLLRALQSELRFSLRLELP